MPTSSTATLYKIKIFKDLGILESDKIDLLLSTECTKCTAGGGMLDFLILIVCIPFQFCEAVSFLNDSTIIEASTLSILFLFAWIKDSLAEFPTT